MHPTARALCAFVFAASFVIFSAASHAQTNVWVGPAVGDWEDPVNWSLGVVPQAQSIPPSPGDVSVRIDANSAQGSSVLLQGTGTRSVGSLQIDAGDALTIADGASLVVGPVLNFGSIRIVGHGPQPTRGLRSVGTLINAPGALLSLDNGNFSSFNSSSVVTKPLFWNQSTTEGYGRIVNLTIQNDGLIDANGGASKPLRLVGGSTTPLTLRNTGTMRARSGGTLDLLLWLNGGIVNTGGTIEAQGDSTVLIENTTIMGGKITASTAGGVEEGKIQFANIISLQGVELDADVTLSSAVTISDSNFTNRKTFTINRPLKVAGTNTISGGGTFKLSDFTTVRSSGGGSHLPVPIFVNVDNTVLVPQNSSVTFGEEILVENNGTFEANGQNASLTLSMRPPGNDLGHWTNTGTIRAVNGGEIIFDSISFGPAFNNTSGVIEVDGDSTLDLRDALVQGGVLRGAALDPSTENLFGEATLEDVRLEGVIRKQDTTTLIGNLENTGTFITQDDIALSDDVFTLTGGGELSLKRVRISSSNSSDKAKRFVNVDNRLLLKHDTSFEDMTFANRGTVEINDPTIFPHLSVFNFNNSPFDLINSGTILATDGATLRFGSGFLVIQNYEIDEQGNLLPGTIQADENSEIRLPPGSVNGGILQAATGGVIRIENGSSLGSLNSPADLQLFGRIEAEDIGLHGIIHNDGQLVVAGDINNVFSSPGAPSQSLQLLGNGELQLNGTLNVNNQNSTFFNGPDHSIIGSGAIISAGSFFTNEGRIAANGNNTLTLTHSGPAFLFQQRGELVSSDTARLIIDFEGLFTNQGAIRVAAGATTRFVGDLSAEGQQLVNASGSEIEANGQLILENRSLINEIGAIVTGDGQIEILFNSEEQRFINNGTLAPGNTVGQLTILGDFEQSTTGDLEIELGGTLPEEFDSLSVWSADLAGLLEVSLVDLGEGEFSPGLGDTFEILALSGGLGDETITGEFDTFLLPTLAANLVWGIQYNPESVVLEILAPLLANLDADGDVDGADFLAIQRGDPSLIPQWQAEFGSRVIESLLPTQAVPEPSTALLALIAFVAIEGAIREAIQARHN